MLPQAGTWTVLCLVLLFQRLLDFIAPEKSLWEPQRFLRVPGSPAHCCRPRGLVEVMPGAV